MGQDFIPLWAIIALSIFSCCTMLAGLLAVFLQRRWTQERRRRSTSNWSEGSDPVTMTRPVRSRRTEGAKSLRNNPDSPKVSRPNPKRKTTRVRFSDAEKPEVQEYDPRSLPSAEKSQRNEELEAKVAELEATLKHVKGTLHVAEDRLAEVSKQRDQLSLSINGRTWASRASTLLQRKGLFVSPRQGTVRAMRSLSLRRSLGILGGEDSNEEDDEGEEEEEEEATQEEPEEVRGAVPGDLEAADINGIAHPENVTVDTASVKSDPRSEFSLCWAAYHEAMVSEDMDLPDGDLQVSRV
mmetsp:Transcript_18630/g.41959  ORF Transcript_18630/g.41959 Transcript_18630/m.41959 type:complete len:297 (-) Transcript_18630:45-935(-)